MLAPFLFAICHFVAFLVVNKRLYKPVCLSVRRSVTTKKSDLTSINAPAQRSRLLAGLSALFYQLGPDM